MLELISAIIFSISANLDNIIIGITYGTQKIDISYSKNILVSLITTFVTFLAMFLAKYITAFVPFFVANIFGSTLLILIGLYTLIKSFYIYSKNTNIGTNIDNKNFNFLVSKKINYTETFLLALTLSCNNVATGIAASITNLNLVITAIFTFIFGFLFIYIGNKIGNSIVSHILAKYASVISGILFVLLGIIEIFNI